MSTEAATDRAELIQASRRYAEETRWLSWWHLLTTVVLVGVGFAIAVADLPLWLRMIGSVATGLALVRLFIIYHDYQHGAILGDSPLAAGLMQCIGLLTLNPPSIWRRSQNHHHGNNAKIYGSQIGSFPVMTVDGYRTASRQDQLIYAASRHPLTIMMGYLTVFLYGMCVRSLLVSPTKHFDSAVALLLHVGLLVGLGLAGWDILLLGFIVPLLIGSALGAYLFYAQHNFPGVRLCGRSDWNFVSAALHSSSFMRMGPLMRWVAGNIGFHHVHHLNPQIPFYRLPEAMNGISALQAPIETSLGWADVRACFRLKLWDPAQDSMVPFSGA